MKRTLIISCCIILSACMFMCKKNTPASPVKNNATCTTCSATPIVHTLDSSGVCYIAPTAITPNGDGINDVFRLVYNNIDTDSSSVTIWNMDGVEEFSGKITIKWDGFDTNGNRLPAGQYPVYLKLKTTTGIWFTSCACVTILTYTGNCIKTNGITYYFPDQIIPDSGFVGTSFDKICP